MSYAKRCLDLVCGSVNHSMFFFVPIKDVEADLAKIIQEAVAEEREACAKVAEQIWVRQEEIADAIRARGA